MKASLVWGLGGYSDVCFRESHSPGWEWLLEMGLGSASKSSRLAPVRCWLRAWKVTGSVTMACRLKVAA